MFGVERVLWYLNLLATFAVLGRLLQCELGRVCRALFLYWLVQAASSLAMLPFPVTSNRYAEVYYGFQILSLLLAIGVVLELYRGALALYPAMAEFGRKSIAAFMSIAAVGALIGVALDSTILPGQPVINHRFLTFERTIDLAILLFLLLMSGFLLWFPVKTKRNIVVYITGFVLFYSSRSLGLLLVNLLPLAYFRMLSTVLLAFSLGCLLLWLLGLRKESQDVVAITGHRSNAAALERLSAQLDQINTALAHFARN
jgi:hypothetical protein